MKSWVWEGWIESINDDDTFTIRVERNDEIIFADIHKDEVREEDREYIKVDALITWYVTTKGCAIRFCKYVYTKSDLRWAERYARQWQNLFVDNEERENE